VCDDDSHVIPAIGKFVSVVTPALNHAPQNPSTEIRAENHFQSELIKEGLDF